MAVTSGEFRASSSGEWTRKFRVGVQVAEYVLERELGEGGMGSVFVARHVTTGQEVALKVLLVDLAEDPSALERFRREGQAQAAAGAHPNVLLVHSAGERPGCAYIVMELARGGDLKTRLRQGPLEPRAAAALIAALARGLAHVHAHGVLHRDLKPANIVFGDDGAPKLMDFGLARLAGADKLTQTGTMLGTPAYMSPEQAGGDKADERADVYGLGAVLYHCLTGRAPFAGASAMVIVRKVLTERPTPPREVVPEVPGALQQIVLRALAKQPGARFPTAKALAAELDRFVAGELLEPQPRGGVVVAFAALVACAIALAGVTWAVTRSGPVEGSVAPVATGAPPRPIAPTVRPVASAPAVSLREPADWLLVDPDVAELTLEGVATGAVVEVRAGRAGADLAQGQEPPVVATSLPARVALRPGWTQVLVRASDAGGARAVVLRRDVVRLRDGLRRTGPRQVEVARDGSTLVLIPPGTVLMHALLEPTRALTRRRVARPYFIGLHEVTWGQLRAWAAATGAQLPPHDVPDLAGGVPGDRDPAFNLRYAEAEAYCAWAGLRLPTAEEWTYAACGEDARRFPWGDEPVPGGEGWAERPLANVLEDGDGFTCVAPVGSFEGGRSPFGLHDMFGNVWEWVAPHRTADEVQWFFTFGASWPNRGQHRTVREPSSEDMLKRTENNGMRVAADVD